MIFPWRVRNKASLLLTLIVQEAVVIMSLLKINFFS